MQITAEHYSKIIAGLKSLISTNGWQIARPQHTYIYIPDTPSSDITPQTRLLLRQIKSGVLDGVVHRGGYIGRNLEACPAKRGPDQHGWNWEACGQYRAEIEEKEVEISLASDMVRFACKGMYDRAILISRDRDFIPAVKVVQAEGKRILNAGFPTGRKRTALANACADKFMDIRNLSGWAQVSIAPLPPQPTPPRPPSPDVTPRAPKESQAPQLPILSFVAADVERDHGKTLSDYVLVLVLHFLTDLIPFLRVMEELGADPSQVFLLRKPYHYLNAEQITNYLEEERDGKKYDVTKTEGEITDEVAANVLRAAVQKCAEKRKKLLILEDGGYFVPLLHSEQWKKHISLCVGAVEQTTKGLNRLDSTIGQENIRIPLINVARSRFKSVFESPAVGETLASHLTTIISARRYPSSTKVLVAGFGTVGQHLARSLREKRMRVTIYDSDSIKRRAAKEASPPYDVIESLDPLANFHLIVGVTGQTTGRTTFSRNELLRLKHDVILASGSSDRLEFDIEALLLCTKVANKEVSVEDSIFTIYHVGPDKKAVKLLCDGYPINFILGEGVPKPTIDPILSLLLSGITLLSTGDIRQPGVHPIPDLIEQKIDTLMTSYYES